MPHPFTCSQDATPFVFWKKDPTALLFYHQYLFPSTRSFHPYTEHVLIQLIKNTEVYNYKYHYIEAIDLTFIAKFPEKVSNTSKLHLFTFHQSNSKQVPILITLTRIPSSGLSMTCVLPKSMANFLSLMYLNTT